MTWYRIKNWKPKNYNNGLEIEIVESEKISESEISDIVYETLQTSIIDEMIAEEILKELPEKPKYYRAMIEQCKIYWE